VPDDIHDLLDRGYRYAVALTADPVRADDLLQEAWVGVLKAKGPRTAPYLLRAIRSRWIDAHRRSQVIPLAFVDAEQPVRPEIERLIEADALWAGLMQLRPEEREVLHLHLVEGWTAREIAEQCGTPRNTVLSWMHRGRTRLKEWLLAQDDTREVIG
jgi:RNA polymerase sigma-70 factor (ECF subfamily)